MSGSERAPRVCNACKARKKGCDKQLPSCGYCRKKGLFCSYDEPPASGSGSVVIPAWFPCVPAPVSTHYESSVYTPSSNSTVTPDSGLEQLSVGSEPRSLAAAVHLQVWRLLQLTELSVSEIRERYFRDFHRWLPVIDPEHFEECTAKLTDGDQAPFDVSVLLIAMAMMVFNPPYAGSGKYVDAERLFLAVKTLFAQAEAALTVSTRLVQAGLLISAYQYACGRPEAAYITVGTCARMAALLGLDKSSLGDNALGDRGAIKLKLPRQEEWNLWWGVVVVERFVPASRSQS